MSVPPRSHDTHCGAERSAWRLAARLRAAAADALTAVRHSGLAIGYAAIVIFVAVTLAILPHDLRVDLLQQSSTNLVNLRLRPARVLVGSAFIVSDPDDLWQVPVLLVAYAYAQRAVGRLATVFIAAIGHIGATLAVATMLAAGIAHGQLARTLARASDVGVSYGLACMLAFLTASVSRRVKPWYVSSLVLTFAVPAVFGVTFTDVGHGVALLLGFGLALIAHRATSAGRRSPG